MTGNLLRGGMPGGTREQRLVWVLLVAEATQAEGELEGDFEGEMRRRMAWPFHIQRPVRTRIGRKT